MQKKFVEAGLIPYAEVRVLREPSFIIDVLDRSSTRRPIPGDEAVITGINESLRERGIMVAKYCADGGSEWIAAFSADELEIIRPAGPQPLEIILPPHHKQDGSPQLFVWREWAQEWYQNRDIWEQSLVCVYCSSPLTKADSDVCPPGQDNNRHIEYYREASCNLCGWARRRWVSHYNAEMALRSGRRATFRELKSFKISDQNIALDELATHLKRRFTDIHSITPRRFEELAAEIFRSLGWQTRLTKKSADGGVDIYLFENATGKQAIVECKRYKRTVGIGIVDRLLGVQVALGVDNAYLVTTSKFSKPAKSRLDSPHIAKRGIELTLMDAEDLLRELGAFNTDLPSLHLHNTFKNTP